MTFVVVSSILDCLLVTKIRLRIYDQFVRRKPLWFLSGSSLSFGGSFAVVKDTLHLKQNAERKSLSRLMQAAGAPNTLVYFYIKCLLLLVLSLDTISYIPPAVAELNLSGGQGHC